MWTDPPGVTQQRGGKAETFTLKQAFGALIRCCPLSMRRAQGILRGPAGLAWAPNIYIQEEVPQNHLASSSLQLRPKSLSNSAFLSRLSLSFELGLYFGLPPTSLSLSPSTRLRMHRLRLESLPLSSKHPGSCSHLAAWSGVDPHLPPTARIGATDADSQTRFDSVPSRLCRPPLIPSPSPSRIHPVLGEIPADDSMNASLPHRSPEPRFFFLPLLA